MSDDRVRDALEIAVRDALSRWHKWPSELSPQRPKTWPVHFTFSHDVRKESIPSVAGGLDPTKIASFKNVVSLKFELKDSHIFEVVRDLGPVAACQVIVDTLYDQVIDRVGKSAELTNVI